MCGIVGYIGEKPTKDFIINGLKKAVMYEKDIKEKNKKPYVLSGKMKD